MPASETERPSSAFGEYGFKQTLELLMDEVAALYRSDEVPWVVGYSGGKDSTATLQLVWRTLKRLEPQERTKPVYVISTDTLVENPVVASWVRRSLDKIDAAAAEQKLPISTHQLTPDLHNTFWVNLLGRGYPAPRPKFRWCTERLKIDPSHQFLNSIVQKHGEAILLLGTRKAESAKRAQLMAHYERQRVRERLSPNGHLPNSYVYSPIEDWTNDDVWLFLMQLANPWGHNNKDLLAMYQGASPDNECPVMVDTSAPSCGDSRFGCWVCTMVEKDRSMQAMVHNDEEKEWMLPLLELRNKFAPKDENGNWDDRHLRDFRRMNGDVQLFHDRPIPGPYRQEVRENWLRELLEVQTLVRETGPEYVRDIELISLPELEEIRRLWVVEKHEIEDRLPGIYEAATSESYPGRQLDDNLAIGAEQMQLLQQICGDDELHYQLVRELLSTEKRYSSMLRRSGLFDAIERTFYRHFYDSEADAIERARQKQRGHEAAEQYGRDCANGLVPEEAAADSQEVAP